jgi:5-hydroxyisourate hydrolase-like protein (transthyretin family)
MVTNGAGDVFFAGMAMGMNDFNGSIDEADIRHGVADAYYAFLTKYNADGSYAWTHIIDYNSFPSMGVPNGSSLDVIGSDIFVGTMSINMLSDTIAAIKSNLRKCNSRGDCSPIHSLDGSMDMDTGTGSLPMIMHIKHKDNLFAAGIWMGEIDFGDGVVRGFEGGGGAFIVSYDTKEYFDASGTYETHIAAGDELSQWGRLEMTQDIPADTLIQYEILDSACEKVLVAQTESTNIDLSVIDISNKNICVRAKFQTNNRLYTPQLNQMIARYYTSEINTLEDPRCGPAATEYSSEQGEFMGSICSSGVVENTPSFPKDGQTVVWNCVQGGKTANCSASRKEIMVLPPPNIETQCKTINIKNITKNSVDLRVSVDDGYKKDAQQFKIEVENKKTGKKESVKIKEDLSDNAMATLTINNLDENTSYRFKVSHQRDGQDEYQYCPHSKEAVTDIENEEVQKKEVELPMCGSNNKTFDASQNKFNGTFCERGEVLSIPEFPNPGQKAYWTCSQNNEDIECSAKKEFPVIGSIKNSIENKKDESKKDNPTSPIGIIITATIMALAPLIPRPLYPKPLRASVGALLAAPFVKRRKEKFWGVVFDSYTKQPQKNVAVSIIDVEKNKVMETVFTDDQGRYGFLIPDKAMYEIRIVKGGYQIQIDKSSDLLYGDLYNGPREFDSDIPVELNIALTQDDIKWHVYMKNIVNKIFMKKIVDMALYAIFITGFAYSIYATYISIHWFNYLSLSIYAIVIFYLIRRMVSHYGVVTTGEDKIPSPFSIVELFQENKRKYITVTDMEGKYYLLVDNGRYNMRVHGGVMDDKKLESYSSVVINNGILRENVQIY